MAFRRGRQTFRQQQRALAQAYLAQDQTIANEKLLDPSVHPIVKQGILNHRAWAAQAALAPPPKRDRVRRPVDGKPVGLSEHQEQTAVIKWWAYKCAEHKLPHYSLFAIPNGGARDAITGAMLKAEGVRPGVPDLMLAARRGIHCGLFIEMKVGSNKPGERQQEMIDYLISAGYRVRVAWNSTEAITEIQTYLAS